MIMKRTNDDDSIVLATDSDVSLTLGAKTSNGGALRADDAREGRAVGQGEEADVGHLLGVLEGVAGEVEGLVQRGLVLGLERPHRLALLADEIHACDLYLIQRPASSAVTYRYPPAASPCPTALSPAHPPLHAQLP